MTRNENLPPGTIASDISERDLHFEARDLREDIAKGDDFKGYRERWERKRKMLERFMEEVK